MQQQKIRPGKVWYLVAGLTGVVCAVLFVFFLFGAIKGATENIITRVKAPGTANVEIEEAGKYTIYFEYESVLDGKVYQTSNISDMFFTLTNKTTGEQIELYNSAINASYSINGRSGKSIIDFEISEPGQYILKTTYDSGSGENAIMAIGKPFVGQMVLQIFLAMGSFFVAIIAPIVIFLITFTKRRKNIRQNEQNAGVQSI